MKFRLLEKVNKAFKNNTVFLQTFNHVDRQTDVDHLFVPKRPSIARQRMSQVGQQ
jgi:hypothetical protein